MNILFVTHPYPNYVPDLLLHGLRSLLQHRVVDYPKKDCLYNGCLGTGVSDEGLLIKSWFPKDKGIDREDIKGKIKRGYFRYIFVDLRAIQTFFKEYLEGELRSLLVIIDGEDSPQRISPGPYVILQRETDGSDFSIPLPMAMPQEVMKLIFSFDNEPKQYSIGFLGSFSNLCDERKVFIETLAKTFPDALLTTTKVPTPDDPMPTGRLNRIDYYKSLQRCRIVINIKGAGFDTFRFWENCCCNAVHVSQRMPLFIPNDFVEHREIIRFTQLDELIEGVKRILDQPNRAKEMIQLCRDKLMKYHLTTHRAEYVLRKLRQIE